MMAEPRAGTSLPVFTNIALVRLEKDIDDNTSPAVSPLNMADLHRPRVEVVYNEVATLGEGPVYDEARNELVWVDNLKSLINFLDLSTNTNRFLTMDGRVGAAIPCASGRRVVAAIGRDISLVDRETGAVTIVASVDEDKPNSQINDCKCDRKGRLWFGTLTMKDGIGLEPKQGSCYCFNGVECKQYVSEVSLSNGIAFSLDWTQMYYIDSLPRQVSRFDYNEETGDITNRKVIIDFKNDKSRGLPDGMTIDTEGKLWVAEFKTSCVCRWDPSTGEMLQRVQLPVPNVTSCCFGGPDYSILYVTTASCYLSPEDLAKYPDSGKIFSITNLGVKGMPPQFFDDSKFHQSTAHRL